MIMKRSSNVNKVFEIQTKMHKYLEDFVNGYTLDHKSKIFYPLIDRSSAPFIKSRKCLKSSEIAKLLCSFYKDFYKGGFKNTKTKKVRVFQSFNEWLKKTENINDEKISTVKKLKEFFDKNLKEFALDFLVHGSLSTLDYTKWSDIDLLIILKRDVVLDWKKLLKLRKNMIKLNKILLLNDPLQHHGCFIICEQEMNFYCQSFLPVEILKYSTSFSDKKRTFLFKIRNSEKEAKDEFYKHAQYIFDFQEKKRISMYEWKLFCHVLLLLPTLYLQTKRLYVYKKDSFDEIKKYFKRDDLLVIDTISKIRNEFYFNPLWTKLMLKLAPNYWYVVIFFRFFTHAPNNIDNIIKDAVKTVKIMCREVEK
jgi:predicted nucleotidyltransferase